MRFGRSAASCAFWAPNSFAVSQSGPSRFTKWGKIGVCGTPKPATICAMPPKAWLILGAILDACTDFATGSLRAVSRYRLPDLVDLHRAHALVVDFHIEPANLEARQIVHEERVDAHSIKGADVAGEQRAPLVVAEIEWGERVCRIGFHRRTESMVA